MPKLPKKLKPFLTGAIVVGTIAIFSYYFAKHPAVRSQLAHTPPLTLLLLLALYLVFIGTIGGILIASVQMCRTRIPAREGLLLTMYSSIVNFFGPLQSGPAFRAAYLKKKHNVKLRDYTLVSMCYYAFYGVFSVGLLFASVLGWWLVLIGAVLVLGGGVAWKTLPAVRLKFQALTPDGLGLLAVATLAQVLIMVVIYYVELHTVQHSVHILQAVSYAGAANLALFVSITPGAIGFRESFLVFSERLHHISGNVIVTANIIDRSVYIVTLLILLAGIVATHAQKKLTTDKTD